MVFSTIAIAVVFYLFLMLLVHEIFKKFFHMVFFIGSIIFFIGLVYLVIKGV